MKLVFDTKDLTPNELRHLLDIAHDVGLRISALGGVGERVKRISAERTNTQDTERAALSSSGSEPLPHSNIPQDTAGGTANAAPPLTSTPAPPPVRTPDWDDKSPEDKSPKASEKQQNFIVSLWRKQGMKLSQLTNWLKSNYQVQTTDQLSTKQASHAIAKLQMTKKTELQQAMEDVPF